MIIIVDRAIVIPLKVPYKSLLIYEISNDYRDKFGAAAGYVQHKAVKSAL